METKRCTKCGEVKALSGFPKEKKYKGGYRPRCKECRNEVHRAWAAKNRAKQAESHRRWSSANKEKLKRYRSEYAAKNPGKNREKAKKWFARNIERVPDHYCAKLVRMPVSKMPHELLEFKREQIKMHRLLKEVKNGVAGN